MSVAPVSTRERILRLLEWVFVVAGAAVSIFVVSVFAAQQRHDLWLAPGIYFIEIILLAILGVISSSVGDTHPNIILWKGAQWIVGGILLSFVILGGFSIGPYLFPAMVAFFLAGAIAAFRLKLSLARGFGIAVLAALIQSALIAAVVVLSP